MENIDTVEAAEIHFGISQADYSDYRADMAELSAKGYFADSDDDRPSDDDNQAGWPGDGSGEDDLADYNANEADDYRDEGDSCLGDE